MVSCDEQGETQGRHLCESSRLRAFSYALKESVEMWSLRIAAFSLISSHCHLYFSGEEGAEEASAVLRSN